MISCQRIKNTPVISASLIVSNSLSSRTTIAESGNSPYNSVSRFIQILRSRSSSFCKCGYFFLFLFMLIFSDLLMNVFLYSKCNISYTRFTSVLSNQHAHSNPSQRLPRHLQSDQVHLPHTARNTSHLWNSC